MNKESSTERLPAKTNVFYDQRVNYALQQNDVPVVKLLQVENTGKEDLRDLTLEVWIEGGLSERGRCRIDRVPAGGVFNVEGFDLALDPGSCSLSAGHADHQGYMGHRIREAESVIILN